MIKCENCCYFGFSEEVEYEHCCFRDWGHEEWEITPCNKEEYYEDDYSSNMPCDNTGYCAGASCSNYFKCNN